MPEQVNVISAGAQKTHLSRTVNTRHASLSHLVNVSKKKKGLFLVFSRKGNA